MTEVPLMKKVVRSIVNVLLIFVEVLDMRKVMAWFILVLLIAGLTSAYTITVDDDETGGNSYGNAAGFAIDFDATPPAAPENVTTGWEPPLVAGDTHPLNSISIQYGGSVTAGPAVVYLGVYSGGVNGGGFLGASINAIDFGKVAEDEWVTWEFEGIEVTVDNVVGSGTGLLYFRYQVSQNDGDFGGSEISTRRLNYDAPMTEGLASIIAYGTLQGARAPEYKADIGSKYGPYDPVVTPQNPDGSVGRIVKVSEDPVVWEVQDVYFNFKAPPDIDEERGYPVNPDIAGHYIYLQIGAPTDPNLYLYDYVVQVHAEDPYETNPEVSYGPLPNNLLKQATTYQWQVECAVDDGTGNPFKSGDPNNILGPVWSFTTASATPAIVTSPSHTLTDASGNASLTIETGVIANYYRWFKVVGQQDTAENGETDDIMLTDSGIFSGTTTKTLFITGAASDGSDDARVYAIAYNGDPDDRGIPSAPSAVAWFWYPRLVNHYPFEKTYEVEGVSITPDIISGYDAMLLSNDTGKDIPVLAAGIPELEGNFALKFDNPRSTDPNSADAQYAEISEGWAGSYSDITISVWVYSSGGSNWNRILDYGNDTANYMFLCVNPGSVNRAVRFAVCVNGTEQSVTSPAESLPDNEWIYVTATLTGSTGRIYINGELVGTNTSFTNKPVSYGPTVHNWLGRSQWGAGDGYFNGMLDDLKIYNYARTTEQIAQDYLEVKGGWVCNYELYDLPYDFNNDCIVDLADFAIFAEKWLDSYRIYPEN